jgi:hypothetical protein
MSYEEVADKFRECAAFSRWPSERAEGVIRIVRGLEDLKDVRELTSLLSRDGGRKAGRGKVGSGRRRTAGRGRARTGKARKAVQSGKRTKSRKRSR